MITCHVYATWGGLRPKVIYKANPSQVYDFYPTLELFKLYIKVARYVTYQGYPAPLQPNEDKDS